MPPRRLWVLFAATTLAPAIGLVWLGWRMVEQDLALETQRVQERREHAADLGAAALRRALAGIEEGKLTQGVVIVVFGQQGVVDRDGVMLPYYPAIPPASEPSPALFAPTEELEFRRGDPAQAIHLLTELKAAKDPAVKAGALVRLARIHRKTGNFAAALAAFRELAALGDTRVNGWPAGLLARQGTALIFEAAGRQDDLKREAAALDADLSRGRWLLTRASYQFAKEQVAGWIGNAQEDREGMALAEAAGIVWADWTPGRRVIWAGGRSVLAVCRATPGRWAVSLVGPRVLESIWMGELRPVSTAQRVEFALTDAEGRPVLGRLEAPLSRQSVRTASATRLPWTVHAISAGDGFEGSGRSRMLLAGVAMMAILILGGGYFVSRAISRELAVAKLQSDFVAAVSHEFRTPLTTMRQLSELLVQDRVSTEDRRRQFYQVLLRESDRMHRLVDSLLNFGRMEAGKLQYRFEPLDPAALVHEVVAEFQQEAAKTGYLIELQEGGGLSSIRADRESLARVFWNLLDNAVKYSPECRTIRVELAEVGKRIAVRVRDRGLGIPPGEQSEIFRKFVRGAASQAAAIQGTGVGLAMARQIVEAHGGEITLESEPGEGSVFTVLLPLAG